MTYQKVLLLILILIPLQVCCQDKLRIMEWNVENLFDCHHDTLKNDYEFLPRSEKKWTPARYWRKQKDIARVILGVGEDSPVDLVGLCEVENDSCMRDLTERGILRSLGYKYVMTDSNDPRGIDVALMYLPMRFHLLGSESWRVPSKENGLNPTRDLLHAWGILTNGDTLHVVVCHFPSRAQSNSGNKNRMLATISLATLVDSLGKGCKLIVLGDFNATPHDPIFKVLGNIVDLASRSRHPSVGTYRYQGEWSWIDHIMVSPSLVDNVSTMSLYTAPWLQDADSNGGWHPRRTYMGPAYHGGVSDHVPTYIDLRIEYR